MASLGTRRTSATSPSLLRGSLASCDLAIYFVLSFSLLTAWPPPRRTARRVDSRSGAVSWV